MSTETDSCVIISLRRFTAVPVFFDKLVLAKYAGIRCHYRLIEFLVDDDQCQFVF